MNLNRRHFLYLLGASASMFALDSCASAGNLAENPSEANATTVAQAKKGVIELPPLPYDYKALEPHIDEATMRFHHDKHHAAYVKNLNAALDKYPRLKSQKVDDLLRNLNKVPKDIQAVVRNNGGGHLNHSMFWQIMKPNGGGEPTGAIATAIKQEFGSFADFKKEFNDAGGKRFGSGWAWLVLSKSGKLEVMSTANQDSPLMSGMYPIMGNDVWEHAYYLKYQNRRADYLEAWWNVVNWDEINRRYLAVSK
ncbi:superoxide dismutase [Calothrix sp. 336/3]|uniref:superoxide dismutase n=1 Tax=Calothrix sp. 336/3 TaxID=1337936 RepID=UPI0004E34230|nr:superoxide dismutase [Calothrix sp. 336/3]AKG22334.1 superoxide dismutase [Calothrix sp. 336/3]